MSALLLVSTPLDGENGADPVVGLLVGIFLLIIAGYFIIDRWVSPFLVQQLAPLTPL